MTPDQVFQIQLPFGYLTWALAVGTWVWPRLRTMEPASAQRAIATFHSFRYIGLAFLTPGFVGAALPGAFSVSAAYGDLATAVLATAALIAFRVRPLFWALVVAFNVVGLGDLVLNTVHAVQLGMPSFAGQLGTAYLIVFLYVPALIATHVAAFALLWRAARTVRRGRAAAAIVSSPRADV